MARENTVRKEEEYDENEESRNDPRLLNAEKGLQGKVTNFGRSNVAANEERLEEEAANEAQYQYELEQIAIAEAEEVTRRAVARKQLMLRERQAASAKVKTRAVGGFARWAGVGVAFTAWFWQFVCAAVSLVGIGVWATLSEIVNGNFVTRAINWGLSLFGSSIESLIPADSFALVFWALATIIAICTYVGFLIYFFITGVRFFDTPLIALITIPTFALSIMPVSNLFPWIPLWVIVVNVRSTAELIKGVAGGYP